MVKILQARLQQYMIHEIPDVQAGFRKGRGTRDQTANICYWLCQNLWHCESQKKLENSERWEYQTTWPASWEIYMQVKKQQLELDMEQQTGSKLGKEYVKVVYCHSAYLTYMQSTSWETLGWRKHKLESRLPGEISITSDMQTSHLWQKAKKN